MSTRLVRKCNNPLFPGAKGLKCKTVMIVDVGTPKNAHVYDEYGKIIEERPLFGVYDEVECIEGCFLAFKLCNKIFHLPTINRTVKRAVYCSSCHAVRFLHKFKELKV